MVDVEIRPQGDGLGHRPVEAAQRRAWIAADERGGVQAHAAVDDHLLDWQSGQCLRAGQERRRAIGPVAVGQFVWCGLHGFLPDTFVYDSRKGPHHYYPITSIGSHGKIPE